ncbi:MAG: DUF3307 domain-containing protein [Chloroflexota bacterium]|mgnify:FL=1
MFWQLLLAHFLADFPLQPMWLVRSKQFFWGLAVHGAVHFLTLLLVVGDLRGTIWLQLLILTLIHSTIDVTKYRLGSRRREWVTTPYFIDQTAHILSLLLATAWIGSRVPEPPLAIAPIVAIVGSAYLVATHVWFVTEKTLAHAEAGYRTEVESSLWPRMLARALFLSGLLFLLIGRASSTGALAATVLLPYYKDSYWRRALVTDILVAILSAIFVRLAAGSL